MLDANLNRAFEALRTLEDIARFHDISHLQVQYKKLRHDLRLATSHWDTTELLRNRDAHGDVGRTTKTEAELYRTSLQDVASAASQRLQQSLRCLEEVSKVSESTAAFEMERLRYRSYDLNAKLELCLVRDRDFLARARLYVLVDCGLSLGQFADRIRQVSDGGADLIQIRDKTKDALELIAYTKAAIEAVDESRTKIIVNDRADVANISGAWGLHVGQTDLLVSEARTVLHPTAMVGLSTHHLEQVQSANETLADYIGCGPTFPSKTKAFECFSGLEFLRQVVQWMEENGCSIPAFAIGGISAETLPAVLETGIQRVAVSGSVWLSESPAIAASRLRDML